MLKEKKAEKVTRFIYELDCSIDKMLQKMKDNSFWHGLLETEM